ncbi:hypothetical protein SOM41_22180 [Enterobacter sp. CFBP8995]|nr:hypothetical protein [Enterobacter sp. CFBP8995]
MITLKKEITDARPMPQNIITHKSTQMSETRSTAPENKKGSVLTRINDQNSLRVAHPL